MWGDGYASNLQWIKDMDWEHAEAFRHADRHIWKLESTNKTAGYWKQVRILFPSVSVSVSVSLTRESL